MYYATICHISNIPEQIQFHTQDIIGYPQVAQVGKLIHVLFSTALDTSLQLSASWVKAGEILSGTPIVPPQTVDEERTLWLLHFELHGQKRIWWAYFHDLPEIDACLTQIGKTFPCFQPKSLEVCPHGLRVCSAFYAPTSSRQQHADALHESAASLRDKQLFPLAPFACEYLPSFLRGLGDVGPCAQCQADAPRPPADTLPADQA